MGTLIFKYFTEQWTNAMLKLTFRILFYINRKIFIESLNPTNQFIK